jgi:hypothetical protein
MHFFPATLSAVHTGQAEKPGWDSSCFSACAVWTALRVAGKKILITPEYKMHHHNQSTFPYVFETCVEGNKM